MIIPLKPLFQERIWGGKTLSTLYDLPHKEINIGECWGISALPNQSSKVVHKAFPAETTLYDLWATQRHLFGHYPAKSFPVLVKLIDAKEDLSIQVHPNDAQAQALNSLGKSECWTILDCQPDSHITIGHHAQTLEEMKQAIAHKHVESIVQTVPIQPGDFFFIEAGTLHAIRKNTFLLEVQQSSDITYRFYDYDREENGQKRELHVEEALRVLKIPDTTITRDMVPGYFDLEFLNLEGASLFEAHRYGDYLVILEGEGFLEDHSLQPYQFYMISAQSPYTLHGSLKVARIRLV